MRCVTAPHEQARNTHEIRQQPAGAPANVAYRLHPAVYMTIAGLALLFIASACGFFGPNETWYPLAIVTGFVLAAIGLPFQLWRVPRHGHDPCDRSLASSWLHADFDVRRTRIPGKDAAAPILLPGAAVAVGMFCLAVVPHFDVG